MHIERNHTHKHKDGCRGFISSRSAHIFKMAVESKILSHSAALFSFLLNDNNVESKKLIKLTQRFIKQAPG